MTPDLTGRAAIVTGASRGLGLEIAGSLGSAGARVLLTGRQPETLRAAVDLLTKAGIDAIGEPGDVSSPRDADRVVERAVTEFGSFQILVNNAGVYGPLGAVDAVDWGEWVRAIEINLFGSVLLARAVLPHFRAAGYGKIVQVSGGGATGPLPNFSAYAASKAGVVRLAETIAHELRGTGIDVNAIAPGALNTRMLDQVLEAGPERVGTEFYERALVQQEDGGVPLERAASLTTYLCSAEADGVTGRLLSAVWDPWDSLAEHKDDLADTDIYTLRRIVPEDRGARWEP